MKAISLEKSNIGKQFCWRMRAILLEKRKIEKQFCWRMKAILLEKTYADEVERREGGDGEGRGWEGSLRPRVEC